MHCIALFGAERCMVHGGLVVHGGAWWIGGTFMVVHGGGGLVVHGVAAKTRRLVRGTASPSLFAPS